MTSTFRYLAPPAPTPPAPAVRPRFSVVVPVFQGAGFVAGALESLLSQTRAPDEILVSDDGSTDDLAAALRPFADRIVLVSGPNAGPAAARNRALARATGDFVAGLDADDAYLPTRLEQLEQLALERPDLDVLCTDAQLESDGKVVGRFGTRTPFEVDDQRTAILDRCFAAWPAVRRERLLAIGGFDERLRTSDDWDVVARAILSGARAGCVDEPLYRYRLREGSVTASRLPALRERVELLERIGEQGLLTAAERRALAASIARKRAMVRRAGAEEAVLAGSRAEARSRCLRLALSSGLTSRERASAVAWALSRRRARSQLAASGASLASSAPWSRAGEAR